VDIKETIGGMFTPVPKEIIQQAFNYDIFLNRKIQRHMGERKRFIGMRLPVRAVHGLKIMRLLNEMDKMSDTDRDIVSRITAVATGKLYPFDEEQRKISEAFEFMDLGEEVRRSGKRALKEPGGEKEAERLLEMMEKEYGKKKEEQ